MTQEPLDVVLHRLAAEGELNYISVAFIGNSYHAAFMPVTPYSGKSFRAVSKDPVEALMEALGKAKARNVTRRARA